MKIGILTYFRNYNPGAFLQAYELAQTLKDRYPDHEVEIIDFQMKREKAFMRRIFKEMVITYSASDILGMCKYHRAIRKLPLSKHRIESDEMGELGTFIDHTYDVVVIGSDELWKTNGYRGFPTPFWLNKSFEKCRKCSFSPSSRCDMSEMNDEQKKIIRRCISELDFVGVRDEKTYSELVKVVPEKVKDMNIVCDPTFLGEYGIEKQKCKERIKKHFKIPAYKKILTTVLHNEDLIRIIERQYKDEYFVLSLSDESDFTDANWLSVAPLEWIEIIAGSDFVVTQSFHCSVFSMIHSVPFLGIDHSEHGKVSYLLKSNGLSDNLLVGSDWDVEKRFLARMESVREKDIDGEQIVQRERSKADPFWQYMDKLMMQNGGNRE